MSTHEYNARSMTSSNKIKPISSNPESIAATNLRSIAATNLRSIAAANTKKKTATNLKRLTAAILAVVMLCCAAVFITACSVPKNIDSDSTELGIPAYSGEPYAVINNNVPFFTEEEKQAGTFESYSELDYLGRCGVAYANVTRELMPTGKRGKIGDIKPTGWRQ